MMSMQKSSDIARKREPDIDLPGQDHVLENGYSGRIRCGRLFVNEGIKADGIIEAETVFIYGEFKGVVSADLVTVFDTGTLVGHSRSEHLKVAGRACGLLHARRLLARGNALIEGEVVADLLVRQDSTRLLARLSVGPGFFESREYLEAAKKRMDVPGQRQEKAPPTAQDPDRPVVALVPREPPRVVPEIAVQRQAVRMPEVASPNAGGARPKATPFLLPS